MTTYSNDPIRIKITMDDLWNLVRTPDSKGIDFCAYPSLDQKDECFIKFRCSDINPHNPIEEKNKDDIEKEIGKFKVLQDHIREFYPYRLFNPKGTLIKECILDPKLFSKENRYDILLDKATDVHRLKNGKLFGTIER